MAKQRGQRLAFLFAALVLFGMLVRLVHNVHAEIPFHRGLGVTLTPSRDVPGRLGLFEEASLRRPDAFEYRLRAGQIRLSRALRRGDEVELRLARSHLDAAVTARPLAATARAARARAMAAAGDADALPEARAARLFGAGHPPVLAAVRSVGLEMYTRTGRIAALREALIADAALNDSVRTHRLPHDVRLVVRRRGLELMPDAVEAAGAEPTLLRRAAVWLDHDHPASAADLRRIAERRSRP